MWLVYASSIAAGPQSQAFYSPQTAIPSAVIASILSGVALLNLHRLKDLDTRAVVTHFSAVATTCSFFVWISIPLTDTYSVVDSYGIVRLIGVGVAATFGQLCLTKAFTTGSPANVSIVGLSQVAVAALVKWAVEQQSPSVGSLIGMGMVIASTIWVMLRQPESTP
jgi:drug/metabolite transporter (DMT)-like permease